MSECLVSGVYTMYNTLTSGISDVMCRYIGLRTAVIVDLSCVEFGNSEEGQMLT